MLNEENSLKVYIEKEKRKKSPWKLLMKYVEKDWEIEMLETEGKYLKCKINIIESVWKTV